MPASTNKSILITPGSYSSLSTSVSQIDLIWYTSGVGTFAYVPNSGDLRSTIYNWEQNSEPVILLGGIGTYNNQRKYVGPYQDFKGSFNGISSFPYLQFYPLSGEIKANNISVNGIASFSEIYSTGLSTFTYLNLIGSFYDQNLNPGQNGQILSSTGTGVAWTSITGAGIVSGKADANQITFWRNADSITGIDTFVFTNGNVGINTTNPLKKLHVRNSGILIDGTSGLDPAPYIARFIIDAAASVEHTLADFRNNNGSVFFVTGSRVAVGNNNVISNVFNVNGGDALINNLTIGLGSGLPNQPSSSTALGISALASNTIGIRNVAVGFQAGTANTSGIRNVFVGQLAGDSILSGSNNTFVGSDTDGLSTGDYQIAIGRAVVLTGSNQGAWGGANSVTRTNLGIGTFASLARLHVETLSAGNMGFYIAGSPSQTADLVEINATTNGQNYFTINGIGSVGVYTNLPTQSLDVNGNFRLRGQLYDGLNTSGVNNQILISTGTGVAWTSVSLTGIVTAFNGVSNRLAKFLDEDTIGNSSISDDGVVVSVGVGLSVLGLNTSYGFYGPGTFITNLNANNLTSGNVPSSVISGNYSGITSVGNLTQLNVLGIASVSALDLNGPIYDNLQSSGTTGQILSSTGTGVAWSSLSSIGIITGSISQNQVAVGSASGSIVGFSTFILDNIGLSIGTTVAEQKLTVGGNMKASGIISASQLISTAFAPTPPLVISSTSLVNNLNVQYWAGQNYPLTTTGDMLYSANDSGTAARIPPNQTTTIKVLTQVGNGTQASAPSWQVLPSAGFIQYFFSGLAATNAPFNFSLANDLPVGLGTTSASVNTGEVLVAQYITDPGVPNLEFLPAGNLSAFVWGNQSFGTSSIQLRVDFFETTSFGTSIAKIVSTNDSTALTSSIERYSLIGITTTTYNLANRNSRIQAKVYAVHGGLGLATANVFYGNGFDSLVQVVAPGADVTNFVPYNGAVYDVDLGIKNLQAGSIGLYTGFSTVSPLQGQFVWNSVSEQVELGLGNGFYVNLGFENALRIYNNTGSPLGIGSVIYVTGSVGGTPTVSLAQANTFQSGTVLGVVSKSIPISSYGYVFTYGLVDYDTTAFTAGDNLYLSATSAGILTNIPPTAPNFSALVGSALNSSASGSIVVLQSSVNSLNEPNRILFANNAKFAQGISTFVYLGGNVGIGTALPTQRLHIQGGLRLTGGLYDTNNSLGSANQILISTGVGISWTSVTSTGIVTAFGGTSNRITKFLDEDTIGNSSITDNGTVVTVGVGMTVSSFVNSLGFYGPGTNITNLNASNLSSGTVPTARISGAYSGITSVGNLTQLNVLGITTSATFVGDGANLTSLNASNLASGTVASARISGAYSGITSVGNLTQLNVLGITTSATFVGDGANLTSLNASNLASGTVASARISGAYSGITSVGNLTALNVTGFSTLTNVRIANSLYDGSFSPGTQNQFLISTGTGIAWTTTNATGIITGTGTLNVVPKFGGPFSLTNSNISDIGVAVTVNSRIFVNGIGSFTGDLSVNNLTIGLGSGQIITNTALGVSALNAITSGTTNVAVGYQAGAAISSGSNNTGVGASALTSTTTGNTNSAFGFGALQFSTSGSDNVAFGGVALNLNTTGINNVAVGRSALRYYSIISNLTAIGYRALEGSSTSFLNTGTGNVAVGFQAGLANTSGSNNTFVGSTAGAANTSGVDNVFIGNAAGVVNRTGSYNNIVGSQAFISNVSGAQNNAFGYLSLFNNNGSNNTAYGHSTLQNNTSGLNNVAVGNWALQSNTTNSQNVAVGLGALRYFNQNNQTAVGYQALSGNSTVNPNTGTQNVALGYQAGVANTSGSNNSYLGFQAGTANTSGSNNVFVGSRAGVSVATGGSNVIIGAFSDGAANSQRQIAIGPSVIPTGSNLGAWGGNTDATRTDLGIGTFTPLSRLHVETLAAGNMGLYIAGSASQTADLVEINATTGGVNYLTVTGIGSVGIYTSLPTVAFDVAGDTRLRGRLFDASNSSGSSNQVLISTGTGIAWTNSTATGIVTGTGTVNTVPKFNTPNSISNSNITDTGTSITLGSNASVSGILTSLGFFGPGTNLTNLNASNLIFGTVPSSVVSGSYSGITSVGNLTQLNVLGVTTSGGYFGPGTNITNLNASNLASGTVPSTVVSGTYSGITSVGTLTQLIVSGFSTINNIRVSGALYDNSFNPGTSNQVLISTGTGIAWTTSTATGIVTGTGTVNTVPKFNTPNSLTNSNITDNGIAVTVNSRLNVVGVGSFTNDLIVNQITVGQGGGQSVTNTAIGLSVLSSNTSGLNNVGLGGFALNSNTSGNQNLALGREALRYYSASSNQIAIGFQALQGSATLALNTGTQNMAIGYQAGVANTSGFQNTFIGYQAGFANTSGIYNTMVGHSVLLANTTGGYNNAFGANSLSANTSGDFNAAFGQAALQANTTGTSNSGFGHNALTSNTTGSNNVAQGSEALRYYTATSNQTAIGYQALRGNSTTFLNTGDTNTAVGYQAGLANTSGSGNTFVGYLVGRANTTGQQNTFVGNAAGYRHTTGSYNNVFGSSALSAINTGNANQVFGYLALFVNTSGGNNHAFGNNSLESNTTASNNVAFGNQTLTRVTTNGNNVAVGFAALRYTTAANQVALGYQALQGSATTELNTGTQNTAVGYQAGLANTSGSRNTFVGYLVGTANTTGADNASFGNESLKANTTGSFNNAFGGTALRDNNTGQFNNAFGYQALLVNTSGSGNVAFGNTAMQGNTTGSDNTAVGTTALVSNTTGTQNVAIGRQSLRYYDQSGHTAVGFAALQGNATVALNTGVQNVAVGYQAGTANTSGNNNTFVGYQAGYANTSGSQNSAIGLKAFFSNLFGDNNTALGYQALYTNVSGSWNTAIGHNSLFGNTTGSNNAALGHGALGSNTTGSNNAAFGLNALASNTTASSNTGVGFAALRYVATSSNNTAVGSSALQGSTTAALNTGTNNTALGASAGAATTSGSNNVFVGRSAGLANTSGSNNVFMGLSAGVSMTIGSNNTLLGGGVDGAQGGDYQIALGQGVIPTASNFGAWGGATNATRTNLGVGTFSPLARIHAETLAAGNMGLYIAGSASQTAALLEVDATTNGSQYFVITGIGSVGIYTSIPTVAFDVAGGARLRGRLFDNSNSAGTNNQVLISTGTGISWTTSTTIGIVTGAGTVNTVPKFNTPNSISNSNITDTGSLITLGSNASVSGILTSLGFFGPGTNLTNLNASSLIFGTVPSSVVSGSYSGITSVGNLTQLNVLGVTTSGGYFGPGTNLTNLNASNLASGTVPSAVVSGAYSGITSVGTLTQLNVSGFSTVSNLRISNALYDGSFSSGTSNQVLISTGTGISWTTATSTGIVTGTGAATQVAYWNSTNQIAGNNLFVYNGIGSVGIGTIIPEYALHVVGTMAATIKSFIIEHPTKPGKKLRYASLEGPENGVYVRGRNSDPYIILPNYWVGLVNENTITVNITPVGSHQNLYVEKIEDYVVYVKYNSIFNKKLDYFYTVYGERKDVSKLEVEI